MRAVVCITGAPDVDAGPILRSLRETAEGVDRAVIGASATGPEADDVVRIDRPSDGSDPVWQGLRWALEADYDQVICLPADESASAVRPMMRALSEADAVIGSRFPPGLLRWRDRTVARAGNAYARLLLRLPVCDATTKLMGFKRHVLEAIHLPDLRGHSTALQVELKHRAHRLGFTLAEVPVDGDDSRQRRTGKQILNAAGRVLQLSLRGR